MLFWLFNISNEADVKNEASRTRWHFEILKNTHQIVLANQIYIVSYKIQLQAQY